MTKIHPTAIISPKAQIDSNVQIGAYCTIGDNVSIGNGTILKTHVSIEGKTTIGKNNEIFPFASIGCAPQDLKFSGEDSTVEIGDNNSIREHVTIHRGTKDGIMKTKIGNGCLLMVASHIAHDCIVHDNVILANNATLAGHVEVFENAIIGGLCAVHQFVKIGQHAIIGGMSGVEKNIIPYAVVKGERAFLAGINLIGLKRANFLKDDIRQLQKFYKNLFDKKNTLEGNLENLKKEFNESRLTKNIISFIEDGNSRATCLPR